MKLKVFLLSIFAAILCGSCATQSQPRMAAAGLPHCVANVIRASNGDVIDVEPASGCRRGRPTGPIMVVVPGYGSGPLMVNGEYITTGDGTCTTYGPPNPSPPVTVCRP
jgi:hypothetical protein